MKTIVEHAADLLRVFEAIRAIPPSKPAVREWVSDEGDRWRLVNGVIEFKCKFTNRWERSIHGSVDEMLQLERPIREVTGENQ